MSGRPGGISAPRPIDDNTRQLALKLKPHAEQAASRMFYMYEPIEYSTQARIFDVIVM